MKVIGFVLVFLLMTYTSKSEGLKLDTVYTGIYVISIHDIDFKQNEYKVDFWLWLRYSNPEFDFTHNLDIPQAKSFEKSFYNADTIDGNIYLIMKLQCTMMNSWKIKNFPFDRQKLRLSIENSQYESKSLIFVTDTIGKHFDPRFTLHGWTIDSFSISTGTKIYESNFGDTTNIPRTEYSNFKVKIEIKRDAIGLFWKMFLGMYVALLISYVCFYIHADSIESRFGLSVGALFAVIGNKYIIDSSLPESISFTLVDTLHGITLVFILAVITSTTYSLKILKKGKTKEASRFDMIAAQVLMIIYLILNFYYISSAIHD